MCKGGRIASGGIKGFSLQHCRCNMSYGFPSKLKCLMQPDFSAGVCVYACCVIISFPTLNLVGVSNNCEMLLGSGFLNVSISAYDSSSVCEAFMVTVEIEGYANLHLSIFLYGYFSFYPYGSIILPSVNKKLQ